MKILIIEDEPSLLTAITHYLKHEGYIIETASDYTKATTKIADYTYDCILVDIGLPNGNGLDIVRQLKQTKSNVGIIIISAKNAIDDKITGLDLGADDYLPKPFDLAELNARIKAVIRRKSFEGNALIVINELSVDTEQRIVYVHNVAVQLTAKEYDLLLFFISNKNRVVSKNAIAEHLWGDDADQMNSHDFIYVHIRNLRKKLAEKGGTDYVKMIYGIGYNFKT
jgi:DNA-binding response OmpR family regulator